MEEKADFLEATQLDILRPQANLDLTAPGMYQRLLDHIKTHHYFMGIDRQRIFPLKKLLFIGLMTVYLPLKNLIQRLGILRDFPGRTETDMYFWIMEYHSKLQKELGWQIEPVDAADSLVERFSSRTRWKINKFGTGFIDFITFGLFEAGPAPGEWRQRYEKRINLQNENSLFHNILVPVREERE